VRAIRVDLRLSEQKYAFPQEEAGMATVTVEGRGGPVVLSIANEGLGLAPDFVVSEAETFGWQRVRGLVDQLDGEAGILPSTGTHVPVVFPMSGVEVR